MWLGDRARVLVISVILFCCCFVVVLYPLTLAPKQASQPITRLTHTYTVYRLFHHHYARYKHEKCHGKG